MSSPEDKFGGMGDLRAENSDHAGARFILRFASTAYLDGQNDQGH